MRKIISWIVLIGLISSIIIYLICIYFDHSFLNRPQDVPFAVKYYIDNLIYKRNRKLKWNALQISEPRGKIEKKTSPSTYRYETGAATIGDDIYVVGGITLPSVYNVTRKVEVYNTRTNAWKNAADFPRIIHHVNIVSSGKKLYVAGGNGFRVSTYDTLFEYDPIKNEWIKLPNMPTSRAAMSLSFVDDKIYAIGGAKGRKPFSTVEVYDIKKKTWETKKSMPTPREHVASSVVNGNIYVFGGLIKSHISSPLNITEMYDPKKDMWEKRASMPVNLSGFSAAAIGKSIFIIGGQQDYSVSKMIFEYKTEEDRWYRRTDLPIERYSPAVAVVKGKIHIIGGSSQIHGYRLLQDHYVFIP